MIAKSKGLIAFTFKCDNYRRGIDKRSKEIIPNIKQIRLRAITLQETIEKYPILLPQYWQTND